MVALTALVLVLAVAVLVALFALMDQHRTLAEINEHLGTGDTPRPLTHPMGPVVASQIGLPAHLDGLEKAVIFVLSTTCATCATIAGGLRGPLAPDLHIVVRAPSAAEGTRWREEVGLHATNVTVSSDDQLADALGLRVTPAAFVLRHDHIVVAQTIPTLRQLTALLDQVSALADGPPAPSTPVSTAPIGVGTATQPGGRAGPGLHPDPGSGPGAGPRSPGSSAGPTPEAGVDGDTDGRNRWILT